MVYSTHRKKPIGYINCWRCHMRGKYIMIAFSLFTILANTPTINASEIVTESSLNIYNNLIAFAQDEGKVSQVKKVNFEDIIKGVASGHYPNKSGSHFGSRWRNDGLFVAEASHDEYSQFLGEITAPALQAKEIKLCHGKPIMWMGEEWSTILTYYRTKLSSLNIVTQRNKNIVDKVKLFIDGILGQGKRIGRDSTMQEFEWIGVDGAITLTVTSKMVQISIDHNL